MSDRSLWQVRIRGLVQGVGFRPTIWQLATRAGLCGEVLNDAEGVLIRLNCDRAELSDFLQDVNRKAPPLARIEQIEVTEVEGRLNTHAFAIVSSLSGVAQTAIAPDAATCDDCLRDIRDPTNRRFGYAFTNCTNCGPRLSIAQAVPYDRENTSMAAFNMCSECRREYDDPADRRFHAQPNACPRCGPRLSVLNSSGAELSDDPIDVAAQAILAGKIVAIRGLGGFQLACDATNTAAVETLRERKNRRSKPFALMAGDLDQVAQYTRLTSVAADVMSAPSAPIALITARPEATDIAAVVAPGQNRLGFMLPNTPLHHLLLHEVDRPLVVTSGNPSSEPQITDNAEAMPRLSSIADLFLIHDRDIVNRVDDSVVQIVDDEPLILRRARGYAPDSLILHPGFAEARPVLATGADLKNTFCLLKDGQAVVSQHIGDMANARSHRDFRSNLALFSGTHDLEPAYVAVDSHPGYFSSKIGRQVASHHDADLIEVQHHHAHVAAVLAEHGHGPETPEVIGVVLDGLGHGADGTLWGGEFLLANFRGFRRLAHFEPVAMPGGDKASQQPWRNTFAHLRAAFGPDPLAEIERSYGNLPLLETLRAKQVDRLEQMIAQGLNAPLASSAGRLFDAVAGAVGICFDQLEYEGQAGMLLQTLAEERPDDSREYPVNSGTVIGWKGLWKGVLSDLQAGVPNAAIAARFHNTLASTVARQTLDLSTANGVSTVVLSGGVFQNALLLSGVRDILVESGLEVLISRRYPANDGGISLGQAVIAVARDLELAGS